MIKIFFPALLVLFFHLSAGAQGLPVQFTVKAEKLKENLLLLHINGTIKGGWRMYATDDASEGLEGAVLVTDDERFVLKERRATGFELKPDAIFSGKEMAVWEDRFTFSQQLVLPKNRPSVVDVEFRAFVSDGRDFLPVNTVYSLNIGGHKTAGSSFSMKIIGLNADKPLAQCGEPEKESSSLSMTFLLGFLGGLLALLTPCVFPMIPLTVSYFASRSGSRKQTIKNGLLYALFIFLIYATASSPFHLLDNIDPEIFNVFSTNIWVNLIFFIVFIFFSLSFFGVFEITLPGAFTNSIDSKGGLGSFAGIFFMALTLGVVSFSCTGPILGTLLVGSLSSSNGAWALSSGMAGFGFALALPFSLFAMFPGWLKKLPASGGWLDTVKKSLAFIELALALKFLSNADLVGHWGIIKREIFLGAWVLIAIALFLYLAGLIHFKYETDLKPGPARRIMAFFVLCFAIYLLPGLTNTSYAGDLNLISGFPPPMNYSIYQERAVRKDHVKSHVINDFERAMDLARKQNKPLLIDFTGWACVNCRKMEENVWTKPAIARLISERFILVSLYVDDRKKLPASKRIIWTDDKGFKKNITTVGDKWATFQAVNFGQVTQPLYAVLDSRGRLMTRPTGYTPDEQEYLNWLQCGLDAASADD